MEEEATEEDEATEDEFGLEEEAAGVEVFDDEATDETGAELVPTEDVTEEALGEQAARSRHIATNASECFFMIFSSFHY
jgi:hypothetical protein